MKRESGFSMIEVMVSVALMLIIMATTLSVLTDAIHANEGITMMADMQENLRAAMNYMVRDIIETGEGIPVGGINIPNNAAGASSVNRPGPPTAPATFPTTYTAIPAIAPGANQGPLATSPNPLNPALVVTGQPTDTITIMYADTTLVDVNNHTLNEFPIYIAAVKGVGGCPAGKIAAAGNTVTFDATCIIPTGGNTAISAGDLIMFQNASGVTMQTVTGAAGQVLTFSGGDAFKLNGTGKPNGTIINIQNGIASPGGPYPPTTATRIWMITYYLDTVTNPQRPQLMRRVNFNAAQPVGEVLEDLEISYDINGGPPSIQDPAPAFSPNQIRKVNLFLAARSESAYSKTKGYFRNNLQSQVSVRSLAFFSNYN